MVCNVSKSFDVLNLMLCSGHFDPASFFPQKMLVNVIALIGLNPTALAHTGDNYFPNSFA